MAKMLFTKFLTYRFRYQIGYSLVVLIFIALLVVAGLFVPGGLSADEQTQFIHTASIDLQDVETISIPNMPFFVMQRISMEYFGPTELAFKLPSLVAAFFAGIGAVFLLRRWFRPNIALLATIIMVTTGQFLFIAQTGAGAITYILWPIWLLLAATMITSSAHYKRFWKLLFFIILPLSLYTPLGIYLAFAICSAGLLHPHVRYVLKQMPPLHLMLLSLISVSIITPLAYLVFIHPPLLLTLLGAPATWPPDVWINLQILSQQYFNFISPQSGALITPVLGLGSIVLILLGIWQQFTIRYTARSYTLVAWILLLVPVLVINPEFASIAFVPLLLLLASGLSYLLRFWYGMFPLNPYARFVGIIPLTILVGGLVISGLDRYFDGYRYDPITASSFSHDISLYNEHIDSKNISKLVVTVNERPFYLALVRYDDTPPLILSVVPSSGTFAATRAAHKKIDLTPTKIITTATSEDADRFYIYKK